MQPQSRDLLLMESPVPAAALRLRLLSWPAWQGVLQPSCTASGPGTHGQHCRCALDFLLLCTAGANVSLLLMPLQVVGPA